MEGWLEKHEGLNWLKERQERKMNVGREGGTGGKLCDQINVPWFTV